MSEESGHLSGRICPMCGADEYQHTEGCPAARFNDLVLNKPDILVPSQSDADAK